MASTTEYSLQGLLSSVLMAQKLMGSLKELGGQQQADVFYQDYYR